MNSLLLRSLVLLALLAIPLTVCARYEVTGLVVGVHDGDTITLRCADGRKLKVRLEGIDAPEIGQPYGDVSRLALDGMVYRRNVTIVPVTVDKYGRTVARVLVGGLDVNLELVRLGLAWRYDRYSLEAALGAAQLQAKAAGLGLWHDPNPTPPWVWRTLHPWK